MEVGKAERARSACTVYKDDMCVNGKRDVLRLNVLTRWAHVLSRLRAPWFVSKHSSCGVLGCLCLCPGVLAVARMQDSTHTQLTCWKTEAFVFPVSNIVSQYFSTSLSLSALLSLRVAALPAWWHPGYVPISVNWTRVNACLCNFKRRTKTLTYKPVWTESENLKKNANYCTADGHDIIMIMRCD